MNDFDIANNFRKGVSKASLISQVYYEEKQINKGYTKKEATTKVEQAVLDDYLRRIKKKVEVST